MHLLYIKIMKIKTGMVIQCVFNYEYKAENLLSLYLSVLSQITLSSIGVIFF